MAEVGLQDLTNTLKNMNQGMMLARPTSISQQTMFSQNDGIRKLVNTIETNDNDIIRSLNKIFDILQQQFLLQNRMLQEQRIAADIQPKDYQTSAIEKQGEEELNYLKKIADELDIIGNATGKGWQNEGGTSALEAYGAAKALEQLASGVKSILPEILAFGKNLATASLKWGTFLELLNQVSPTIRDKLGLPTMEEDPFNMNKFMRTPGPKYNRPMTEEEFNKTRIPATEGGEATRAAHPERSLDAPVEPTAATPTQERPVNASLNKSAAGQMLGSIMQAETGSSGSITDERRFIRTRVTPEKNKGRTSSAYGPVQMTKSYLETFKNRGDNYKSLPKEEQEYLDQLIEQGGTMIKNPNDPTYGYGKKGTMGQTEKQRQLYSQIAQRSIVDLAHRSKNYSEFIKSFRGEDDRAYFNKIENAAKAAGKTPEELFQELKGMKVSDVPNLQENNGELGQNRLAMEEEEEEEELNEQIQEETATKVDDNDQYLPLEGPNAIENGIKNVAKASKVSNGKSEEENTMEDLFFEGEETTNEVPIQSQSEQALTTQKQESLGMSGMLGNVIQPIPGGGIFGGINNMGGMQQNPFGTIQGVLGGLGSAVGMGAGIAGMGRSMGSMGGMGGIYGAQGAVGGIQGILGSLGMQSPMLGGLGQAIGSIGGVMSSVETMKNMGGMGGMGGIMGGIGAASAGVGAMGNIFETGKNLGGSLGGLFGGGESPKSNVPIVKEEDINKSFPADGSSNVPTQGRFGQRLNETPKESSMFESMGNSISNFFGFGDNKKSVQNSSNVPTQGRFGQTLGDTATTGIGSDAASINAKYSQSASNVPTQGRFGQTLGDTATTGIGSDVAAINATYEGTVGSSQGEALEGMTRNVEEGKEDRMAAGQTTETQMPSSGGGGGGAAMAGGAGGGKNSPSPDPVMGMGMEVRDPAMWKLMFEFARAV